MFELIKFYFRDKIELNLGLKILISICDKYLVQFVYEQGKMIKWL